MPDREKAIKELSWFLNSEPLYSDYDQYRNFREGIKNALELLIESRDCDEPVVPVKKSSKTDDEGQYMMMIWYECPACGFVINGKENKYCGGCGRKVNWE